MWNAFFFSRTGCFITDFFTNGLTSFITNGRHLLLCRPCIIIRWIIWSEIFYLLQWEYRYLIRISLLPGYGWLGPLWEHWMITVVISCSPFHPLNGTISTIWNSPNVLAFGVLSITYMEPSPIFRLIWLLFRKTSNLWLHMLHTCTCKKQRYGFRLLHNNNKAYSINTMHPRKCNLLNNWVVLWVVAGTTITLLTHASFISF